MSRISPTCRVCVDEDGNLVVSHRHLSEATKIDRQTGEVLWRLGGAHDQFTWVNDGLDGFRNQHDVNLIFNKFGDPNVAFYRIYAGTSPQ
jgi:hypothetical protein